jgi:hypothetical protein
MSRLNTIFKNLTNTFTFMCLVLGLIGTSAVRGADVSMTLMGTNGNISVDLMGIDRLANGFHYEGWAIIDGAPAPAGKFNISAEGNLVDAMDLDIMNNTIAVNADLSMAAAIVITIEPDGDMDTEPAATKYLGGEVMNGSATLSTNFPATLGSDFMDATGKYILATPTNGPGTNENSGIWFLELVNNTLALDLGDLDPLHNGFHYEGWIILDGMPYSTGKFNVNMSGELVDMDGMIIPNGEFTASMDVSMASDFVLTIEPAGDIDAVPAKTKYLGGPIMDGKAALSTSHPATLNSDYMDAAGSYILATPTNGPDTDENSGIWFLDPTQNGLQLSLNNVAPLHNGFHYEGWAIVDGMPVSTGKFNINDMGAVIDQDGMEIMNGYFEVATNITGASDIVITIEPDGDMDPMPAATKLIGGMVADKISMLNTSHSATLGSDFDMAMGGYILATPTNGADTNENSGIWFLDPTSGTPEKSLNLSTLPDGWIYEGWVVIDGVPVTTGTFSHVMMVDNAAPFSGSMGGPPFPGEDFLMNAPNGLTFPTDLAGRTAVISIEPVPDDSPMPFSLKPLVGAIPMDAVDHTFYSMDNMSSTFPTATAQIVHPTKSLALPDLPEGWVYEGWVVIDGTPVTTGIFIDAAMADSAAPFSGSMSGPPFPGEDFLMNAPDGLMFPTDLAGGTAVISIEPYPDDSPMPFSLKPLVGMISMNATDHTLYSMDNNSESFPMGHVQIKASPAPGLALATLPAGWAYEGWVVIDGTPVTTGKFTDIMDADWSAPFSGAMQGPPFPGEDYLQNAPNGLIFPTNLAGGTAVISIEPMPDDSEAPFTLKPLVGMIPENAGDHMVFEMGNNAAGFPTGMAMVEVETSIESNETTVPMAFALEQNYPNPFNPSTTIQFSLVESENVSLTIYNIAGQQIATLVNGQLDAGVHSLTFEAESLPSGLYIYQLKNGANVATKRMNLLK